MKNFYIVGFLMCLCVFLTISCDKKDDLFQTDREIIVTESGDINYPIKVDSFISAPVEGGLDTIYVFSKSQIEVEVNGNVDWIIVSSILFNEKLGAYEVVYSTEGLQNNFIERKGQLNFKNEQDYSHFFLTLRQGYKSYLKEDFSWLRYGHGDPMDLSSGVLINQWTPAQKEFNWKSEPQSEEEAYVYGKDGYVQLGNESEGANLLTPIVSGVQDDSILMISFNAVAYTSKEGVEDKNRLTITLIGGEFEAGETKKTIELNRYDYASPFLTEKMWDNTFEYFRIKKQSETPYSTTLQVKFTNGEDAGADNNRVFLDNIIIYSVEKYEDTSAI